MRKPTIMDIASRAGVSKATVSMVVNKKDGSISKATREKILNIIEEVGYIPNSIARSLSTNKSGTIGITIPDIMNPFFSQIARAIEDAASKLQYNVILCNTDNSEEKENMYIKLLISKQVDGVIFISGGKSRNSVSNLKSNNIPFVLVDRYIDGYKDEFGVYCENKKGVMEGVEYLYSKGKRKIVFVSGPTKHHVSKKRLEGYKVFMEGKGIYDENLIFQEDLTLQGGMEATKKILESLNNIDAIFYSNDLMALGGIKVLTRMGYSIPKDISIMGFDNIQITEFVEPELTTIAQPIYEMGQSACELLVKNINGEDGEKIIFFTPKLIIRGTA